VPGKRVKPAVIANKKRRKIYRLRTKLREKSFYSENYKNPGALKAELMPLIKKLQAAYRRSLWTRLRLKIKSFFKPKK
jgi:hypothetical protein